MTNKMENVDIDFSPDLLRYHGITEPFFSFKTPQLLFFFQTTF